MYKYLIMLVLLISGCTASLWEPEYQRESLNGFYVKSDTRELFVTTTETAYLLAIDEAFGEALKLSRQVEFIPHFDDFKLDSKNRVKGSVTLTVAEKELSPKLVSHLESLGFTKNNPEEKLQLKRQVTGKRYLIEGELPLEKLQNEYPILIAQPRTFTQTAGRIIATPATITIDAVVTVPAVFLAATIMAAGSP
ncbi:hypothetical protein [Pseudoalteromonas luteoviolacea]|uniref:Uncharacterized protein n=1 Tax=Pseudoalteromonas luteoviolacea DSM 6061 TaxID=1365250 RepID=A0A166X719_9GAMM|nr:hypothetical protein [Pseudoalteromonas luteoviolacea]KZN39747.1 hypothetical protein N475_13385 [Pseudoalteromonas luteoviolacea DSM 6061]MBE0385683.1 hypothetical protein [Pseudoalteromonas luteoviolacea DSM 6061]